MVYNSVSVGPSAGPPAGRKSHCGHATDTERLVGRLRVGPSRSHHGVRGGCHGPCAARQCRLTPLPDGARRHRPCRHPCALGGVPLIHERATSLPASWEPGTPTTRTTCPASRVPSVGPARAAVTPDVPGAGGIKEAGRPATACGPCTAHAAERHICI